MDDSADLGELILERKSGSNLAFGMVGMGALIAAAGTAVLAGTESATAGRVALALAAILIVAAFFTPRRRIRFHERGLTDGQPWKDTYVLRYEEIEHMRWRSVKPNVGVTMVVDLVGGRRRIRFTERMDTGGAYQRKLERVREQIARFLAMRVHRQIEANEPFSWGPRSRGSVRLLREGLAYRPIKFVGKGDEQLVPWGTPLRYVIREGGFGVFADGAQKALFTLACEDVDFYPGLLVFASMSDARQLAS